MRKKSRLKLRKNTRYFLIIVSLVVFTFSICEVIYRLSNSKVKNKDVEMYSYVNKFNYNYKVNLIPNKYIEEQALANRVAYVTDLIDTIDLNLNYEYEGSVASNVEYTYRVMGRVNGFYADNGEEQKVLDKQYILTNEKTEKSKEGKIKITESVKLNLLEQNELIKDFQQKMNMVLNADYSVILSVKTKTLINGETVENTYQTQVKIGLADKTTKITGDNNKEAKQYINSTIEEKIETSIWRVIIDIILSIISLFVFVYVSEKTENMNRIKNEYRREVNTILKLCREKIIQVNNKPEDNEKNVFEVKDFGELIKLSEEIFKPILYWENKEKDEAWFVVMSNNFMYKYILRK